MRAAALGRPVRQVIRSMAAVDEAMIRVNSPEPLSAMRCRVTPTYGK